MKKNNLLVNIGFIAIGISIAYLGIHALSEKGDDPAAIKRIISMEDDTFIPTFREIKIDFNHKIGKSGYDFVGGATIDIDNDGIDEIFIGGSDGQADGLFAFVDGVFINIAEKAGLSKNDEATYGAYSIDSDNDGDTDLFVARESDVYLYTNTNGIFTETPLNLRLEENSIPLSMSIADTNKDGQLDLYVNTFINKTNLKSPTFNDDSYTKRNYFLRQQQDGSFIDMTNESGLSLDKNTFVSSFVDLNNDNWLDLVVATDADKIRIYRNNKDGTFEVIPTLSDYGFWMGLGIGDIDNDGDEDLFFSNIGSTIPSALMKGDAEPGQIIDTEWRFWRNNGDFSFSDMTVQQGITKQEFARGAVIDDFNLDGLSDLVVTENSIHWPAHKINKDDGRFYIQAIGEGFVSSQETAGIKNKFYGQSPLISDVNNDGYPDIIFINLNGPARALINEGGQNNYLTVVLPDSPTSIGARVSVERSDGIILYKQVVAGEGFATDQTNKLFFGLGREAKIKNVQIDWPSGQRTIRTNIENNTILEI